MILLCPNCSALLATDGKLAKHCGDDHPTCPWVFCTQNCKATVHVPSGRFFGAIL